MTKEKSGRGITVRLPDPLRRVLDAHLERHDLVRSRFVRQAITEKLKRDRQLVSPSSVLPQ